MMPRYVHYKRSISSHYKYQLYLLIVCKYVCIYTKHMITYTYVYCMYIYVCMQFAIIYVLRTNDITRSCGC